MVLIANATSDLDESFDGSEEVFGMTKGAVCLSRLLSTICKKSKWLKGLCNNAFSLVCQSS